MYASKNLRKTKDIKVPCTETEKSYITIRAGILKLSAAEYLRELAMNDAAKKPRSLPPEALAFNGQLAQLIGSLEIISRRRLDGDDLNALERAELLTLTRQVKELIKDIKRSLK